jgi:hypothetical protein
MTTTQAAVNPFVLMVNPQAVFAAIENSDRLARLASRICRPLDRHQPGVTDGDAVDAAEADLDAVAIDAGETPHA